MELSLEELYVPEQASLSVFPWLIGIEEAKEILKKDGVLEGDYEVIDSGDIATITVHKVKLKEFSLPMDFSLIFQKDFYLTNQSGFVLSGYGFVVNEIDGVKVPPARELWGKTENKALENYEEERQKWLKKADQKYRKKLKDLGESNYDMFSDLQKEDGGYMGVLYAFPGYDEKVSIRLRSTPFVIHSQIDMSP